VNVVVAAAILDGDRARLLAAQRSYPSALAGRWELPGGKVGAGEDERAALVRECREELGVSIEVLDRIGDDVPTVGGDAVLRVWWARIVDGTPTAHEHQALRWLPGAELRSVDWLDADVPVIDAIRLAWPGTVTT
jgi:8-oxo-dGTP diphosphatase